MKRQFFFLAMLFWSMFSFGQQFTEGGIKYNILNASTVEVIANSPIYTGTVTIPATATDGTTTYSVTAIGISAFYNCTGLTSVTIPNSVTAIGNSAFKDCSGLTSVTIPNSVTAIGTNAFQNCSGLTSVTIPNSVTKIYNEAFFGCSGLTSVTIPSSVTTIGNSAFYGCSGLPSVTIPNSVTTIYDGAFAYCSNLASVTIPNSVTAIHGATFLGCSSLTSVAIPNSVTTIGYNAFNGCNSLTSLTIPNSVTSIDYNAFNGCTGLTSVTVEWTTPLATNSNIFQNVTLANVILYVPAGTEASYAAAAVWKDFGTITLGIKDVQNNSTAILVYPNPTTNFITLKNSEGINQVKVFSLEGKLLKTEKINSKNATLDLSYLPKGVYLLQTNRGSIKVVKK